MCVMKLGLYFPLRLVLLALVLVSSLWAQAGLESTEPKERIKAVKNLGDQKDAVYIPQLAKLLDDPVSDVRYEAVVAIIKTGTQHSLVPLMRATRDAMPEIQAMAVDGLVNFYYPGYVRLGWMGSVKDFGSSMKSRFSTPEPMIIDPFVRVDSEVVDAIGRVVVGGSSMDSRAEAARAAGVLRARGALPQLQEALRSRNTTLILEAVRSIEKIGDVSAGPSMTFLLKDPEKKVQRAAVEAMGQLRVREAVPDLVELVKTSSDKGVRRQALISVAKMPTPGERDLFLMYLRDGDKQLRAAAAEGLGRSGSPDDLKVITEAFAREKDESPRLSMAFAAVYLGDLTHLDYLLDALNSRVHRGEARPFLTELARRPEVLAKLYEPLAKGTKDQKKELCYVMSYSGDRETLEHLERLSHDPDTEVAQEAIRAMRTLQARL